jgi:uncharacterized protein YydD (DUF2326 family)
VPSKPKKAESKRPYNEVLSHKLMMIQQNKDYLESKIREYERKLGKVKID